MKDLIKKINECKTPDEFGAVLEEASKISIPEEEKMNIHDVLFNKAREIDASGSSASVKCTFKLSEFTHNVLHLV